MFSSRLRPVTRTHPGSRLPPGPFLLDSLLPPRPSVLGDSGTEVALERDCGTHRAIIGVSGVTGQDFPVLAAALSVTLMTEFRVKSFLI